MPPKAERAKRVKRRKPKEATTLRKAKARLPQRVLDRQVAARGVSAALALVEGCKVSVARAGGKGYVLLQGGGGGGRRCGGLTARLQAAALPRLPPRGALLRRKGHLPRSRFGGSSAAVGMRVDAEVAHIVACVGGGRGAYEKEVLFPAPRPPRKRGVAAAKQWACDGGCGLSGARYDPGRPRPGWHRWTLAYLRDVAAKGLTLVASQVPVAAWVPAAVAATPRVRVARVATEMDDLAVDAKGETLVAIERKTGYEDVAGRPRKRRHPTEVVAGETLWNTEHTLHQLQAEAAAEMLRRQGVVSGGDRLPVVSCVVYVSGKSYVPDRDPDKLLECVWVWPKAEVRRAARAVVDTL